MTAPSLITCEIAPRQTDRVKVIQITDTHIVDENETLFNDFDSSASLKSVIETIKTREDDADLVLLTGDLVHEPTDNAYQRLADHLATMTLPLFYLPGNHDDRAKMHYVMGNNGFDQCNLVKAGNWAIALLDSHVPGQHAGAINQDELDFLHQFLDSHPHHHALVALHHHPVPIESPWMDGMSLTNATEFLDIIDDFENVKAVVWGHIHQDFESERAHCRLLGTPSTCMQFTPRSEIFDVDDKAPAYRRLVLHRDGRLETDVKYIDYN